MMSVLVVVAGLATTHEASAQQATRKPVTHKGTAKRSLVKQSANKPLDPAAEAQAQQILAGAGAQLVTAPSLTSPDGTRAPSAPMPKAPAAPAPPTAKPAPTRPAPIAAKPARVEAQPLRPKSSSTRAATPSPAEGTAIASVPSIEGKVAGGPSNRVTDRLVVPPAKPSSVAVEPPPPPAQQPVLPKVPPDVGGTSGGAPVVKTGAGAPSTGTTAAKPPPVTGGAEATTATNSGTGATSGASSVATKRPRATPKTKAQRGGTTASAPAAGKQSPPDSVGTIDSSSGAPVGSNSTTGARKLDPDAFAAKPVDPPSSAGTVLPRFHTYSWSTVPGVSEHVTELVWCSLPGGPHPSDPADLARRLQALPQGRRALALWDHAFELADHPLDRIQDAGGNLTAVRSPFMQQGIAVTAERLHALMKGLQSSGAPIDFVILDYERGFAWQPEYHSLDQDPRWQALANDLGYPDLSSQSASRILRWNEVMGRWFDDAIDLGVAQPVRQYYPAAKLLNYESFTARAEAPMVSAGGGIALRESILDPKGRVAGLGSHDSSPYFGLIPPSMATTRLDGFNAVGSGPFEAARIEIHRLRALRYLNARPQAAWIAPRSSDVVATSSTPLPAGTMQPLKESPYWDEMLLQLGMNGAETWLYWNDRTGPETSSPPQSTDTQRLGAALKDLNGLVGTGAGDSVYRAQPAFDDRMIATGREVDGQLLWRLSFDPAIESVRLFFTDNTSVVVTREADRPGAWFSHNANKALVFDADNTAPAFEIVTTGGAVRTDGATSGSDVGSAGSGSTTGSEGSTSGGTQASGGSDGGTGSGAQGGGTDGGSASGGARASDGDTVATGSGSGAGSGGSTAPPAPTELELLVAEALAALPGERMPPFSGTLRYVGTDWAAFLNEANQDAVLAQKISRFVGYQQATMTAPRDRYVRPMSFDEIPPDMVDSIALGAGPTRDARALSMSDVSQSYFLMQKVVPLAVAARYTGDSAMLAKVLDVLTEVAKYTPLQRQGWSLGTPGAVLGANGDGPNMATSWGISGVVDILSILGDAVPADLQALLRANLRNEVRGIAFAWAKRTPWYVQSQSVMSNQWSDPSAALAKACLFLGEPELLPAYNLGVENLAATFRAAQADGAFLEGVTYAQMSGSSLVSIVGDLNENGDTRLAQFPFVSGFWRWLLQMQMPGGYLVNCCDSNLSKLPPWARGSPMSTHIAAVSASGASEALPTLRFAFPDGDETMHGLQYAAALRSSTVPPAWKLPLHDFFPSQQLLVWRSAFEPAAQPQSAVGLWIKGGTMLEKSHGHRDQGQVTLHKGDRIILMESGTPQDYGDPELDPVFASAAGHNIMQVGARSPRVLPANAPMTVHQVDASGGHVTLDLKGAYTNVNQVMRSVTWQSAGTMQIEDLAHLPFAADAGTEFYRFHTGSTQPLTISGDSTSWKVEWPEATMTFVADVPIRIEQVTWRDNVRPPYTHQVIKVMGQDPTSRMLLRSGITPSK
jgi:hypothetical protein